MIKYAVVIFLMLIAGLDVVRAQSAQLKESKSQLIEIPQKGFYTYSMNNWHQENIIWYRKTDSIMINMTNRQWDSMMSTLSLAQKEGIMNYKILVLRDSMQKNRITSAQLIW